MTDQQRSLGLTRNRVGASYSSKISGPLSSSRSHGPLGLARAGERRAKVPLRARKIIGALDAGIQKVREKEMKLMAEQKERLSENEQQLVKGTTAERIGSETAEGSHFLVYPPQGDGSVGGEATERGSAAKVAKTSEGWTRCRSDIPKQAYLTSTEARQSQDILEEKADSTSVASSSSTTSSLAHKSSSIPRVPLFSSASKREIQSLTSRKALQDVMNPITHSTVGAGTLHYISSSTGHQQANRVGVANASAPEGWWHTRMRKLKDQAGSEEKQSDIFRGLSVYINGYAGTKIGNKELQRLLSLNGAEVHYLPNGSTTHIVSEMPLSAKKTQEMLQLKAGRVKKFVKVDWILDSLQAGKRRPEHPYAHPIAVQRGIAQMLDSHSSGKATSPGVGSPIKASSGARGGIGNKTSSESAVSANVNLAKQDWREAARSAAAHAASTATEKQKRCS